MTHGGASRRPRTQGEWFGEQAYSAWQESQAALGDGRIDEARRWLERARRYAPADGTIALSLATVLLRLGETLAATLFDEVAQKHDLREAWLGLAAAHARTGHWPAAAAALAKALSRHVFPPEAGIDELAARIVEGVGAPGWCCQRGDGRLDFRVTRGAAGSPAVVASLDGVRRNPVPEMVPTTGAALALTLNDKPLLGSPLDLTRTRALDGFVEASAGELSGWAWHPANPEADPVILVHARRPAKALRLTATIEDTSTDRPLARPRRFSVAATALAGLTGPLRVTGLDGRDLAGSPLDPGAEAAAATALAHALAAAHPAQARNARRGAENIRAEKFAVPADIVGPPARAPRAPARPLAVVVPVYRDENLTLACLAAVRRTMPEKTTLIVVDDATPEPALATALDDLAHRGAITLLRHSANTGFPGAANTGLAAAAALPKHSDVVLLNSDALVTAGALAALRSLVQAAPDIGTATPLSNDATILSYPERAGGNSLPQGRDLERLGRLAARANAGVTVDIPTAIGFCMYIRRECLLATGLFRDDVFAQGYGEENDFCLRARHLGWRHVAAPGVYVGHAGGKSFNAMGAARQALLARNITLLERLNPGYHELVEAHGRENPLAEARRRLDTLRFARRATRSAMKSAILVTHDMGGGVERVIRGRCETLRQDGIRPIVLRPVRDPDATSDDAFTHISGLCEVCDGTERDTPNLRFSLPGELDALARLLRPEKPQFLELHHLLGHDHSVVDLAKILDIPCDVHIHDYAWFCPRIALIGPARRYCGEPINPADCEACIADAGRNDEQDISVADLRVRSAGDFSGARRVIAYSSDAATRISRHFPMIRPAIVPLEDDAAPPPPRPLAAMSAHAEKKPRRVGVIGGIGTEKGFDVLLACARDAAARNLPLEFVIIGHTTDDAKLFATGRVFITGPYREERALEEIAAQAPDLAFLPSIWPETWCYTLGHAWRAGLYAVAFDIGAPAERIGRTGRGRVIPLGLPPASINDVLLAARGEARC